MFAAAEINLDGTPVRCEARQDAFEDGGAKNKQLEEPFRIHKVSESAEQI